MKISIKKGKVTKHGNSLYISIPKELVDILKIGQGDHVKKIVDPANGRLIIEFPDKELPNLKSKINAYSPDEDIYSSKAVAKSQRPIYAKGEIETEHQSTIDENLQYKHRETELDRIVNKWNDENAEFLKKVSETAKKTRGY